MPESLFVLLGIVIVGVIAVGAYVAHQQNKARLAALSGLAARLGWRFHGDAKDRGFDDRHPQFSCFRRGSDRYAHNRLLGPIRAFDTELSAEAGDYHYETSSGSGKDRRTQTHRFSYLLVTLPFGWHLPSLRVRPENLFDKLAGAVGFEDIDFESAEFSRRHHVSSSDRRFAYALIDPRMIEFLLGTHPPTFELGRGVLLVVAKNGNGRWEAAEFAGAIRWAGDFLARWPAHLVSDLRPR